MRRWCSTRVPAKCSARGWRPSTPGVKEGQLDANGDLAAPVTSDRWVRDAQRQRLHVVLDELPEGLLPTGAKATVQLYPGDGLSHLLGRAQIVAISLLHYVY